MSGSAVLGKAELYYMVRKLHKQLPSGKAMEAARAIVSAYGGDGVDQQRYCEAGAAEVSRIDLTSAAREILAPYQ